MIREKKACGKRGEILYLVQDLKGDAFEEQRAVYNQEQVGRTLRWAFHHRG